MKHISLTLLATLSALATQSPVFANEEGLYGAAVPTDAAFIRWVGDSTQHRVVFDHSFDAEDIVDEAYVAVSEALLNGAQAGGFYSVVADGEGGMSVIQEPDRTDTSKVHMIMLNGKDSTVSLRLAGTDTTVVTPLSGPSAGSRAVNPVSARLAVHDHENAKDVSAFDVSLRRGQNITIAVLESGTRVIENRFGPVVAAE